MEDIQVNGEHGPVFIFAHGAGAGMMHPFMETVTQGLVHNGIRVIRFNFPYMIRQQLEGKKFLPDRGPKLILRYEEMIDAYGSGGVVIGGKSMGGRIASLVADHVLVKGVACLGFPFHPLGKPDKIKGEHLATCSKPCLILQGERDALGRREEVEKIALSKTTQVHFIPDGDHGFKPRQKSGYTEQDNLSHVVTLLSQFIWEVVDEK